MDDVFRHIRSVDDMAKLNGVAFENYLAMIFQGQGYDVDTTPTSGDYGADLILVKDGRKIVVQAKQYVSQAGFDAIKDAHFARDYYKADEAWVVATHGFTPQAVKAAEVSGVRLLTGADIAMLVSAGGLKEPRKKASVAHHSGAQFTFRDNCSVLVQCHWADEEVVIPEDAGITEIGDYAFSAPGLFESAPSFFSSDKVYEGLQMKSVIIPEGVRYIGRAAFRMCENLESVYLPSTLEKIGEQAFKACPKLSEVILPPSLTEIASEAFANSGIKYLELPPNVKLGDGAFSCCQRLASITPAVNFDADASPLESIPKKCFWFCTSLESVSLPTTVKWLREGAFAECTSLQRIELPESLVTIGPRAFAECSSLEHITILGGARIGQLSFEKCGSLKDVDLHGSPSRVFSSAFKDCPLFDMPVFLSRLPKQTRLMPDDMSRISKEDYLPNAHKLIAEKTPQRAHQEQKWVVTDSGAPGLNFCEMAKPVECIVKSDIGWEYDYGYYCVVDFRASQSVDSTPLVLEEGYLGRRDKTTVVLNPGNYLYLFGCKLEHEQTESEQREIEHQQEEREHRKALENARLESERDRVRQSFESAADPIATEYGSLLAEYWRRDGKVPKNDSRQIALLRHANVLFESYQREKDNFEATAKTLGMSTYCENRYAGLCYVGNTPEEYAQIRKNLGLEELSRYHSKTLDDQIRDNIEESKRKERETKRLANIGCLGMALIPFLLAAFLAILLNSCSY